jgi:DNA-binding LytR/AlgR family response regulator
MLRVAVVEEDYVYVEYLKSLLFQWADKKTEINVSTFVNGTDLVENLTHASAYDVIFMDLSPNQPDGILAAKSLRDMGYKNLLVLTAAFGDRACEGYQVNAYRYYVKPVMQENIKECMDYAFIQKTGSYFQYTYHGVAERIAFRKIVCFESRQHYIDIHTLSGIVHIKRTLKEIQKQCPAYFLRCQRSYIVNINCILSRKGSQLKLINGKVVTVSPRYLETVVSAMGS